MKKISFLMAALLVAMVGCQKEPAANDAATETAKGDVYMSFSVQLPETRSQTDTGVDDSYVSSDAGEEVGKTYENEIKKINIFLKNTDNGLTTFATNVAPMGSNGEYVATFQHNVLTKGTTYEVYIVCNDNTFVNTDGLDKAYSMTTDVVAENIASQTNGFLMTNAKITSVEVAADHDWTANMTKGTAFNLGTVEVERSVARFDYAAAKANNIYEITGNANVKIQLTHAGLINMSKEFYYFRRVAAAGVPSEQNPVTICGVETANNFVIDTDAEEKETPVTDNVLAAGLADNFIYHMNPSYTALSEITTVDTDGGWTNTSNYDYKIWRYVTENTIPNEDAQVNGISTGVVFKGILTNAEGVAITGSEALYVYNNIYYGAWSDVEAAAQSTDAPAGLKAAYEVIESKDTPTEDDYKALNFTVYRPTLEGGATTGNYEVLYYYWNRHHDNRNNQDMGPMEFAVVRNNVYKLAVTNISKFGHPENGIDPDPVDPTDPDEVAEYYFTVAVKVLPWTVRVNNIEF